MKAEHRKELQTNVLADRMGRLVQGMKSGTRSTSAGFWVIGLLVAGIVVAWYYAKASMASDSAAWVKLNAASDPSDFKQIALENRGTLAARTARFQQARRQLHLGLQQLYGNRLVALYQLEEAAKVFGELIGECSNNALLQQEALMGAAKAEEARLVDVPRLAKLEHEQHPERNATDEESRDAQYNRALELYRRLARDYPESYLGEAAAKHAREMTDEREKVLGFYAELGKLSKPATADAGGTPSP